ncbi:serine hydrolase domain-containing protein [Nocardiopsis ganjiahuensis]|uniref:serine hydrolase domain-containing protein n=1 Tax=Nocardiopsis ganjiahuensis TaxID=239984 RepID=UPI0003475AD7|nr:serine hydrolase domain-containing protein [Nocardiopsis ganjiahuensis]
MAPPSTTRAQENRVPTALDRRLTRLLEGLVAKRGVHHANIALSHGTGDLRWSAASGPADTLPIRPETPFFVASITKRFIITLLLQAHERGELDLDASITEYLPEETTRGLHVLEGTDHTAGITPRHLASHTSGLPDFFEKRRDGRPSLFTQLTAGRDLSWSFEDALNVNRTQQSPYFAPQDLTAPRQKARYSDTGFQLLIRTLETVTDRSFSELLTDRVLGPLGLERTWTPADTPPEHSPLHTGRRRVEVPSILRSSNDLFSTTGDLITFQRALLGGELLSDLRPLTERRNRLRNAPVLRYGLGTMIFRVGWTAGQRPVTLEGHSGSTGTWLFHCPELDLHLTGTVDQTRGRALPFRFMAHLLRAWKQDS